ncbi:hypothetical protein N0V90_006559 [Kalmusia sp. IMI 367209]|nr:hypothetical protein N0V90_006559 [Kalmusia sp. IMI 367209]
MRKDFEIRNTKFTTELRAGLTTFFTMAYIIAVNIVGYHGSGLVSYNLALTAVFVEGFIFIFLSLIGMRQWLVRIIPVSLKIASACGIGLFLSEVGLGNSAGIGAISGAKTTPLEIAGCPDVFKDENGFCLSHKMTSPTRSRGTSFTYFPDTMQGDDRWSFFKQVANFHPITTLNVLDWNISTAPSHFVLALFTFLYVDIVDCTATLYSMARFSGVVDPDTGDFPRSTLAYCTDAFCISIGALLGCSPVTAFIESGAGIAEGGKTGLTAMTCGFCFFVSMFFAPIFASIPSWATGCTLVLVGCLMMRQVVMINWRYIGDAVPAFVTVMFVPFGYSAAYGLIAGIMVYAVLNGLIYITKLISRGHVVPDDEDHREYWTSEYHSSVIASAELTARLVRPHGKLPWFITASQAVTSHFGHGSAHDLKTENASLRSSESRERFRSRSRDTDRELDTVVVMPRDPRNEKVLRKI